MSKRALIAQKPLSRSFSHAEESNFLQTDLNGTVISGSEELTVFTGLASKDIIGYPLLNIVAAKDSSKLSSFLKRHKSPGTYTISFSLKGKKKKSFVQLFCSMYLGRAQSPN